MRTCSWKEILRRNTFKYWISLDGNTNIFTSNKWILSVLCTFNYSLRIAAPLGLGWKVLNCPPPPFPPKRGPKTSAPGLTSLPSPPLLLWSITTPLVWKSEEDSIWKSIAYQHWKGSWLVFILHICLPFFVRMQNWRHSQVYVSSERAQHCECTKTAQNIGSGVLFSTVNDETQ